jgi:hypothetical protein
LWALGRLWGRCWGDCPGGLETGPDLDPPPSVREGGCTAIRTRDDGPSGIQSIFFCEDRGRGEGDKGRGRGGEGRQRVGGTFPTFFLLPGLLKSRRGQNLSPRFLA